MEEKLVGNAEFFPTRLAKSDAYLGTMGCCSRWRYCWVGGWCPKSLQSWFRRKFFPLIFLIKCTNDLPFRLNWNHWIVVLLGCFFVCVCGTFQPAVCVLTELKQRIQTDEELWTWMGSLNASYQPIALFCSHGAILCSVFFLSGCISHQKSRLYQRRGDEWTTPELETRTG